MPMVDHTGVSQKELQKFYADDVEAQAVLDHFANRERNQNTSLVRRLMANLSHDGSPMSRGQLVRILKAFEELRCGVFKAGRKGHESRFEWSVSSRSVGQVAAGESAEIEQVPEEDQSVAEAEDELDDEVIEHTYQLRPGLAIRLNLPSDFSGREAERLAMFIKTLPFSSAGAIGAVLPAENFSDWEK